jgi:acylphosphatase
MRYCITISGKVQGVFFRKHAEEIARSLGIRGYVMNQADGTVYCEAEGPEESLEAFTDWCGEGSPMSRVTGVEVQTKPNIGYSGFEIRK